MVRGTDRKTLFLQPRRSTTWSWAPSRIVESRVRSSTWLISYENELNCQRRRERHYNNNFMSRAFKLVSSARFSIDPTNMSAWNWTGFCLTLTVLITWSDLMWFFSSGDEENLLQLSAATINAEWLVGSMLGQSCQGQCASGSCSACRAAATDCSEQKQPAEGTNVQKPKVVALIRQLNWPNEQQQTEKSCERKKEGKKESIHVCFPCAQVSNKQRKEQQRQEKKKRQEERHRQKFLQSRGSQDQNLPEAVTLVPALNTLSI